MSKESMHGTMSCQERKYVSEPSPNIKALSAGLRIRKTEVIESERERYFGGGGGGIHLGETNAFPAGKCVTGEMECQSGADALAVCALAKAMRVAKN